MEGEGQEEELSVLLMGEKEERGGTSWDPSFFLALDLRDSGRITL